MKVPCEDCISYAICNAKKTDLTFTDFMLELLFNTPICELLSNYVDGVSDTRGIPGIPETRQFKLALKKIKRLYKYNE